MKNEKKHILEFVQNLNAQRFAPAEKALEKCISEKIKTRIRKNMKK